MLLSLASPALASERLRALSGIVHDGVPVCPGQSGATSTRRALRPAPSPQSGTGAMGCLLSHMQVSGPAGSNQLPWPAVVRQPAELPGLYGGWG